MLYTHFGKSIKYFHSTYGEEYFSNQFFQFLALKKTTYQTSYPYALEQYEIAERKHCHIVEIAKSLLTSINVPSVLWG